jgi:methylated-DNA-protein-cysteine methyltransferase related protein
MPRPPAERRHKQQLIALLRAVPVGRVVSTDVLAMQLGVLPVMVSTLMANFTDDERDTTPWHRAVAKGGAIGRGPHRDAQFARLVREGVPMSPAGIVQDMMRVAITDIADGAVVPSTPSLDPPPSHVPPTPLSRSRAMKDRPR